MDSAMGICLISIALSLMCLTWMITMITQYLILRRQDKDKEVKESGRDIKEGEE